jgi:hypothetical protein
MFKIRKRTMDLHCSAQPCLGLAFGVDQYTYSSKRKRTWTLLFLCFTIEVKIVKYYDVKNTYTPAS